MIQKQPGFFVDEHLELLKNFRSERGRSAPLENDVKMYIHPLSL